MSEQTPTTYDEFWPFYVRAHTKPLTRKFHAVGTSVGLAMAAAAVIKRRPSWIVAGLAAGYGAAWFSHFFIERNVPATFGNPLWSFRGDFEMLMRTLDGTMDAEVERHTRVSPSTEAPAMHEAINVPTPNGAVH